MNTPAADLRAICRPSVWETRRLWSLRDMINFYLGAFILGRTLLRQELDDAHGKKVLTPTEIIPNAKVEIIKRHFRLGMESCVEALGLRQADPTCVRILNLLNNHHAQPVRWGELHELLNRLWDELELGLASQSFFRYSKSDAMELISVEQDWKAAIAAFPSAKAEIAAGLDCFALGDYPGCVFHMCRVAEIGLRAIGRERGIKKVKKRIPINHATWGEILEAIEPRLEDIRKNQSRGPQKEAALKFYSTVLSDLRAIQSYRDASMHFHDNYDKGQAESAKHRVKELMNTLASKLDEDSTRAIPWSAWRQPS